MLDGSPGALLDAAPSTAKRRLRGLLRPSRPCESDVQLGPSLCCIAWVVVGDATLLASPVDLARFDRLYFVEEART